jgi:hypothetical protein
MVIHPKDKSKLFEDESDKHLRSDKSLVLPVPQQKNADYEFDILKNIDEEGNMHFPPHTGNTQTKIDTLPGAADLKKKKK